MERWSCETTLPEGLPGDLADLSVVHGAEDGWIANPLADPQFDTNAGVEEEHGSEGQQEKSHHDEGGVGLPVRQSAPCLLTANVVAIIQEVVFDLRDSDNHCHNDPNKGLHSLVKYSLYDTCK